jgi:hypothetical protein
MKTITRLALLCAVLGPGISIASATTEPAKISDIYQGGFKDDYPQELVRVRSYVLSVQSDVATQLGLQYGQGFLHPVTIRFDDGAPAVSENPYFYVQTKGSGENFMQELVVNVEAYAKHRNDWPEKESTLRGGFSYALTELMLNDIAAGDSDKALPLWVQEGLAVFASGDGDAFVKELAVHVHRAKVGDLVGELNSPGPYLITKDWALYYLAVKFIAKSGGLQTFVRDIISGKSTADTVRGVLGEEWPVFVDQVRAFAIQSLSGYAMSDDDLETPASTGRYRR